MNASRTAVNAQGWVPDDELEDVKAMVPGYVEQEEDPIQREIEAAIAQTGKIIESSD